MMNRLLRCFVMVTVMTSWCFDGFAQDYPEDRNDRYERKERGKEPSHQQEDELVKDKRFDWKRVIVGGGFGATFGTITAVDISPLAGYYITEDLLGGLGVTYQFLNDKRYTPDLKTHVYGGSVFGRYFIYEGLFAHAEYELLNYEVFLVDYVGNIYDRERVTIPGLLLGGGYQFGVGERAGVSIAVLFDVLNHPLSNYPTPILRLAFNIGL